MSGEIFYRTGDSPNAVGAKHADIVLGVGTFELTSLAIAMYGTNDRVAPVSIYMVVAYGDGSHGYYTIASGWVASNHPFVWVGSRFVQGPATIQSAVVHGTVTMHALEATYRKVY